MGAKGRRAGSVPGQEAVKLFMIGADSIPPRDPMMRKPLKNAHKYQEGNIEYNYDDRHNVLFSRRPKTQEPDV